MILGSNQPYFFPYIGYWQLINAVDVFEICDDFNYIKRGWVNRNRILVNGDASFFNIEIQHATSNLFINQLYLSDFSVEKKLKQIQMSYSRAPYFDDGYRLIKEILEYPDKNLGNFLTNSIKLICNYLGITTKIIKSSDYQHDRSLKKEYGIYDSCSILGADTYYNAIGGQELYSFEDFRKHNIKLCFIKTNEIEYKQYNNIFVPNLSIIDVIMFNSVDSIKMMLDNYALIDN